MAYHIIQQHKDQSYGVVILSVDKESEIKSLPTWWAPGSKAIIIENNKTYILNGDNKWEFLSQSTSGGGDVPPIDPGGEGDQDKIIIYDGGLET